MRRGMKLVTAAGAATVAAAPLAWAGTAAGAAEAQNHREEASYEFTLPNSQVSCTVRVFTDLWDDGGDGGLGYTSTRIHEPQGPNDPCVGDVSMTVDYIEEGGGAEHLFVRGGSAASVEVNDVAEPYPSRSFRVEHTAYFGSCDCQVTYITNPK